MRLWRRSGPSFVIFEIFAVVFFFFSGLFEISGWASQSGRLESDSYVFEQPTKSAKSLDRIKSGSVLEVSNLPTQGFYKIRTSRGIVGWISGENLKLEFSEQTFKAKVPEEKKKSKKVEIKPVEKLEKYFKVGAFGNLSIFGASGIINQMGNFGPGLGVGLELGYYLFSWSLFLLRFEQVSKSQIVYDTVSRDSVQATVKSYPLQAGFQFKVFEIDQFSFFLTALGGMGFQTGVTSTSETGTQYATNIQSLTSSAITGLGKVDVYVKFGKSISAFGELGYRYLKSSQFDPYIENGSIFAQSFLVDLSGPVIGLGLSYLF